MALSRCVGYVTSGEFFSCNAAGYRRLYYFGDLGQVQITKPVFRR